MPPAHAAGGGDERDGSGSAVVGAFTIGDGLEANIDARDGSFQTSIPVAGVHLRWNSGGSTIDRSGLGPVWDWGLSRLELEGGLKVVTASGDVHSPDPTHPSGLAGYGAHDVVFEQRSGVLEARLGTADAPGDNAEYEFVLHELGGVVSYYNAAGDPVAREDSAGTRTRWRWDDLLPHRLIEVIEADEVRTELDWAAEPGAVLIRSGAHGADLDGTDAQWRIELDGGRVSGVTDPVGGRISVEYTDGDGLLSTISGPSGAATELAWRAGADSVPRVARVRTVDSTGAELSARSWAPAGDGTLPSGWPRYGGEHEVFWSGDPGFRYTTALTDGATRVESTYSSLHSEVGWKLIGSLESGETVLRETEFSYPGDDDGGPDPAALPGNWAKPVRTQTTFRDPQGGSRIRTELATYDDSGRAIEEISADGTVSSTTYDTEVPEGRLLPIGLAVVERTIAPDHQIRITTHTPNEGRNAVVATEVAMAESAPGKDGRNESTPPLVTEFSEFEVDERGRVVEQRVFPAGDRTGPPMVSRWHHAVDPSGGTRTRTETLGVGTPAEASTAEATSLVHGTVVAVVDQLGTTTSIELDALGRPIRRADGLGRMTRMAYESAGVDGRNAVTTTTPDGVSTTEVHDALGRTVRVTDNILNGRTVDGHVRVVETRAYPEPGTVEVTDAWGGVTTTQKDVFGRPRAEVRPSGLVVLTVYDDVADTITVGLTPTGRLADAEFIRTQQRDAAGQVIEEGGRRADGAAVTTTTSEFDGFGRMLRRGTDTLAQDVERDVRGDPVRTTFTPRSSGEGDAPGDVVPTGTPIVEARRFDGRGNSLLKTVSDERSARPGVERELDALGRTIAETDQTGRVSTTSYTADGLVARVDTGGGQVIQHDHHPTSRLRTGTVISSSTGDPVRTAVAHDPLTDRETGIWDPADRAATEIRTARDAHGNPTRISYPDGHEVVHRYDANGRRTHTTDIAGNTTTFDYDDAGRLSRATQRDERGELFAEVSYERDALDRITRLTRGNGVVTEYTFTSASEIATEHTTRDGRTTSHRAYEYDAAGNLTRRVDTISEPGDEEEVTATSYAYDVYDRLVRSVERTGAADGPIARETAYTLTPSDDVSVETTTVEPGSPTAETTAREFAYDPLGRLTGIRSGEGDEKAQSYDAAGNLTAAVDGTTYTYDAANRPVTETSADGSVTRIRYWADGSRRGRDTSRPGTAASIEFYWDGDTLLNDVHGSDDADDAHGFAAYLIGAARHSRTTSDGRTTTNVYYGADRHGSILDLTDASGDTVARNAFGDYGATRFDDPRSGLDRNPFGYAGEYTDPSGTQHLDIRDYDPGTMRFLTMDTAELHNLYNYADLNPITRIDPTGRSASSDHLPQRIFDYTMAALAIFGIILSLVGVGMAIHGAMAVMRVAHGVATVARAFATRAAQGAGTFVFEDVPTVTVSSMAGLYVQTGLAVGVNLAAAVTSTIAFVDDHITPIVNPRYAWALYAAQGLNVTMGVSLAYGVRMARWRVVVERQRRYRTVIAGDGFGHDAPTGNDTAFNNVMRGELDRVRQARSQARNPAAPANGGVAAEVRAPAQPGRVASPGQPADAGPPVSNATATGGRPTIPGAEPGVGSGGVPPANPAAGQAVEMENPLEWVGSRLRHTGNH